MPDSFIINPDKARKRLGLDDDGIEFSLSEAVASRSQIKCAPRTGIGSRYPGELICTTIIFIHKRLVYS